MTQRTKDGTLLRFDGTIAKDNNDNNIINGDHKTAAAEFP
jgi:hypothetical protein